MKLCECGCGKEVSKEGNRFIYSHNRRGVKLPENMDCTCKYCNNHFLSKTNTTKICHKCRIKKHFCKCGCRIKIPIYHKFVYGHNSRGKNNGMYNKKHTEKTKEKISEANTRNPKLMGENNNMNKPGAKEKVKRRLKKFYETKRGTMNRKNLSKRMKENNPMNMPGVREKYRIGLRKSHKLPSSYEQKIIDLCNSHNLPFRYVGNFKKWIGGKNPDFIDENRKLIIETYFSFYKNRDYGSTKKYEKERSKLFKKEGYDTLYLDENDISVKRWEEICLRKIKGFMIWGF